METEERLQKILARAGYGSRRTCETMIEEGRVTIDGRIAQLGDKANPSKQRITVDGVPIRRPERYTYVMLNKPRGHITTTDDPQGRRTVLELIPLPQRLYPVGRLDADSEGLLLMTNDGELAQRLTHPRYGHARVYRVLIGGEPTDETLERWRKGVTLDERPARFKNVTVESSEHGKTWLQVTVTEGRKHLVRRIVAALGHPALRLIRVSMGTLRLGTLRPGQWRHLTEGEVNALRKEVGATARRPRQEINRPTGKSRPERRPYSGGPARRRGTKSSGKAKK